MRTAKYCVAELMLMLLLAIAVPSDVAAAEPLSLRVMTYNLWHGGDAGKQPLEQTVQVIRDAKADIVGLQETGGLSDDKARPDNAHKIAQALGWHYLDQGGRTGVISRWPVSGQTPNKWGVQIKLPNNRAVWIFNAHYSPAPYQPYQLLKIPYGDGAFLKTADEAIAAAKSARGGQVKRMLAEIATIDKDLPTFITGDFNEPSHQDWTMAAAKTKCCPLAVEWPTTKSVVDAGFVDTYRQAHPNEITHRGRTWTPITSEEDPKDRHDRIDFVFANGAVKIKACEVVGESPQYADIVVKPYPSDHRAVVATVLVTGP